MTIGRRGAALSMPFRCAPPSIRRNCGSCLPNIVVIEVEQAPLRFRYRLVGTRVVEFNKLDFTGSYLGTIGWDEEQQFVDAYVDVVSSKQPLCGFYSWTLKNGNLGKCEFGIFPLSQDGETVTQMFAIEDYDFPRDYSGARSRAPAVADRGSAIARRQRPAS